MPHVKDGQSWRAGESIKLERWQKFKHACVFGWVHKTDGRRRFRTGVRGDPAEEREDDRPGDDRPLHAARARTQT